MHAILDQYDFLERYQSFMNTFSAAEATNNFDGPDFKGNELFIIITLMVASLGSIALKDKSALAVTETWRLEREWKRLFTLSFKQHPVFWQSRPWCWPNSTLSTLVTKMTCGTTE